MAVVEHEVAVEDLQIGQYVSRLDRPWKETDFSIQGLLIRSQRDIDRLAGCCRHVYVDQLRSWQPEPADPAPAGSSPADDTAIRRQLIGRTPLQYPTRSHFEQELEVARKTFDHLWSQVRSSFSLVDGSQKLRLEELNQTVRTMVDSIIRNPDAGLWLTRLRSKDEYSFLHAINTLIWCVAMGRHLGLPRTELEILGLGGLMLDVGKLRLPGELLSNTGRYTEAEHRLMQQHVAHGVAILQQEPDIPPAVIEMLRYHHERHDGSGYREGLKGDEIPLFARIAGLADCYSAMTSERSHARAQPPQAVLNQLYGWRGSLFQPVLVEQFIQVLGTYPVGTLVELSTGQVAVVVAQNRTRRLRPRVMLLLDAQKRPYADFDVVDLNLVERDRHGEPLDIVKTLEAGAHGIDPDDWYL